MHADRRRSIRRRKLERLRSGDAPRTLELCSGCGGLSLGLASAGFELSAHVELDPEAARSYALNFAGSRGSDGPWAAARNMETTSVASLVQELELADAPADAFDVLAAGLPCQAFARIGRSKLREIAGTEDAFRKDPRAILYRRFLQYVEDSQPLAILIENVPDILNFGGHNIPEEICEALEAKGYSACYTILNAAFYGVPQMRERLFILAIAEEIGTAPVFPAPLNYAELPRGYEGSRRVALKYVRSDSPHFRPVVTPDTDLPAAVSAKDALDDLPRIHEHRKDPRAMRRRPLSEVLPYETADPVSAYAQLMRDWPGFETQEGTNGHLVRLTPRDFPIFRKMKHGDDYPVARELAERMFAGQLLKAGLEHAHRNSKAWRDLWEATVPPYDPGKFPNRWWKLTPDLPSRTLTAHMGKDTYSHIHYDGQQARTVSVREAARLQSFPDGFRFAGAMNAAFRQIGNAVPPLLAQAVAQALKAQLSGCSEEKETGSTRRAA